MSTSPDHQVQPAQRATTARRFFPQLEGMRAVAAIAVLTTHVSFQTAAVNTGVIGPILGRLDLAAVDAFTRDTGAAATIFARTGDDFVRIATSLQKEDGSRAMGTPLGAAHPARAGLLAGNAYLVKCLACG